MRRRNNKSKLVALILCLALIGIGYAALTVNLKLKGTANISNAKWDIHFENAKVEEKSDTVTFSSNSNSNLAQGLPVIKGDNNTELEWEVVLNQPGDYYYISADIVNAGDYDAELDLSNSYVTYQIEEEEPVKRTLETSSLYSEDIDLFDYSVRIGWRGLGSVKKLSAGNSKKISIGTSIDDDLDNEEWENIKNKTIKLKLELNYIQEANNPLKHPRITVENAVVNGHSDTITILPNSNSNSNIAPSVNNKSINYGTSPYSGSYTEHTIDYSLIFNQPGDYYEFSANIISKEDYYSTLVENKYFITIDNGEPIEFSDLANVPEYFNYQVTTNDRVNSRGYYFLNRIETENVTVRIELKNDLTPEQLAEIQGKVVNINYFLKYRRYNGTL